MTLSTHRRPRESVPPEAEPQKTGCRAEYERSERQRDQHGVHEHESTDPPTLAIAPAVSDLRFPGRSEMLGTLATMAASEVSIDDLMARLKADVFRGRIRLREFFRDFDPLRAGVVTEAKFRTALDESGLKLNDPEMTQLARHFADPADAKRVRYEALLSAIESVFTTSGMEADPNSTVDDFTPAVSERASPFAPLPRAASPLSSLRFARLISLVVV